MKTATFVQAPRRKHLSRGEMLFKTILLILCVLILISILYPIYFILIASISDSNLVGSGNVVFFPKGVNLYGYQKIFQDSRIWIGYKNTLVYTALGTIAALFVTIPAAYAMSRPEFKARKYIMVFFMITMFFNGGIIPTYLLIKNLGMFNSVLVYIIPGAFGVYNMIITRTFIASNVPNDLFEAASIDGCSHFRYFFQIVVPLSKAVISVVMLYSIVGLWNNFFTGLLYITKQGLKPLQNVLRSILLLNQALAEGASGAGGEGGYAQRFADQIKFGVIIVSTLPVIIIYPFLQKYFEKGVMIGAIKG